MLTLLSYLVRHEYLPSIVALPYLLIGVSLAILTIKAIGWQYAQEDDGILCPVVAMCAIVAEWPLIVLGYFVFSCIVEWKRRTGR